MVQWSNIKEHLKKVGLPYIDLSRVFNLDESAFFLVSKGDRVLARSETKSVYKFVHVTVRFMDG